MEDSNHEDHESSTKGPKKCVTGKQVFVIFVDLRDSSSSVVSQCCFSSSALVRSKVKVRESFGTCEMNGLMIQLNPKARRAKV